MRKGLGLLVGVLLVASTTFLTPPAYADSAEAGWAAGGVAAGK